MNTITLSIITNEAFFLDGRKHFRASSRRRYIRFAIQSIAGVFLLVPAYVTGVIKHSWFSLFFIGLIGVLACSSRIDWLIAKLRIRKSPYFGQCVTITLRPAGLLAVEPKATSDISWTAFTKAVFFEDGVLLFQGQGLYNWLPKTAFSSADDYSSARDLIKIAVPKHKNA